MKNYKITCICTFIILLSGCNAFSTKTEATKVSSEVVKSEPVVEDITQKEKDTESIVSSRPREIESEIASPIGESQTYFTYEGDVPFKISLINTGTESFIYKIRNVDKETDAAKGVLKSNEDFDHVFEGLPEGAYVIYCVVEEEEPPSDIKLKVKVELLY
ncbi:hypothetical protein [Lysinibacillus xylanilyticus]|uniref:hypothetical protein n=1 Tax=Lysinibacillus xylanilyticus TaxID=582475 RepID=UPI0036DE2E50